MVKAIRPSDAPPELPSLLRELLAGLPVDLPREREARVAAMERRWEQARDIWSGEPLGGRDRSECLASKANWDGGIVEDTSARPTPNAADAWKRFLNGLRRGGVRD
jgi:hypothetical protein